MHAVNMRTELQVGIFHPKLSSNSSDTSILASSYHHHQSTMMTIICIFDDNKNDYLVMSLECDTQVKTIAR